MELCYIHYKKDNKSRYFYFIPILQEKNKLIGIKTRDGEIEFVSDKEAKLIKEKAKEIDSMSDNDKYNWFSQNVVNFSRCYASLLVENIIDIFNYRM